MTRLRHCLAVFALLLGVSVAAAQEPVRPPARDTVTVPEDTTGIAPDTAATEVMADSVYDIPQFPRHDLGTAHGFSDAIWTWDRDALLLEGAVTIGDLLERIPGILTLRSGSYLQPEAATSLGGTGNRLVVWVDGYALDPLLESSFDIAKFELVAVERVRVERRLGNIHVHIETLAPKDNRAYSMVQAAVGQPDASLFRGLFLIPRLFFGPLSLGIDRVETDGLLGSEPADQFTGWGKWSAIHKGVGVQVEYRRAQTERDPNSPWPSKHDRSDLLGRARVQISPAIVAEFFGGRAKLITDSVATITDTIPRAEEESTQWGGHISVSTPVLWARGSYRARSARALPESQLEGAAGLRLKVLALTVEAARSVWREVGPASELTLRAEVGPFAGFRLFGETTTSDRGVPYLPIAVDPDSVIAPDSSAVLTSYEGYRVGASLDIGGISLGGALLKAKNDAVTTFGLPFDRTRRLFLGNDVRGGELTGRVPLPLLKGLYAQGSITQWRSGTRGLYLPERIYRAGLELHSTPLKSGNLEILARVETIHRGLMLVPNPGAGDDENPVFEMAGTDLVDGYLQIRIIDVRAFVRYEDMTGQDAPEVALRPLRGPRIFYGVKWQFWN